MQVIPCNLPLNRNERHFLMVEASRTHRLGISSSCVRVTSDRDKEPVSSCLRFTNFITKDKENTAVNRAAKLVCLSPN